MAEKIINSVAPGSSSSQKGLQLRLRSVQVVIMLFFLLLSLRLVQVQIVQTEKYRSMAERQYKSKIVLRAARGTLTDRNGTSIASNTMLVSFAVDPLMAGDDARAIAGTFSQLFGRPRKAYLDKLQADSRFVWLERGVSSAFRPKIDAQKFSGMVVRVEPNRLYYHDGLAGQLVGATDVDNNGIAGLELAFDKALRGNDGYVVFQRDGRGNARPSVDYPRVEPVNGDSITLTIDMRLQAIAERELRRGIEENKAEGGIVVLLQPRTGEVLAMAQYPPVDPSNFGAYGIRDRNLRAVADIFEPGSVFKIVTASAALEHSLVTPGKTIFAENGTYVVAGRKKPIVDTHKEGWITFQEGLEVSSNIVMAKVSDLIGAERFYTMARNYGFGIPTDIDFPGEEKGVLKKPSEWSGTTLNTMAFGYEVGATPIQIASAYGALANDGVLMKPYLFRKEIDPSGQVVREATPQRLRRVVSSRTAGILTGLFEGVVERGTGKLAAIEGVRIAGKTGTSRKYVEGKYETGSYTASFVGFLPADDPRMVCLVMLDNPRGGNYTGGTTSAPVFRAIAEQALNISELFAPEAVVVASGEAQHEEMVDPLPEAAMRSLAAAAGTVPNVKGCSVRRAMAILQLARYEPVVSGSGTVVHQEPTPGQPGKAGMKVRLICQPKSSAALF